MRRTGWVTTADVMVAVVLGRAFKPAQAACRTVSNRLSAGPTPQWAVRRATLALVFSGWRPSSEHEVIPRARPAEVSLQAARASR